MKHQNKGQNLSSRRFRSRVKDAAIDPSLVNAGVQPNEVISLDPVVPPTARESGVSVAPVEPLPAVVAAIAEPACPVVETLPVASEVNLASEANEVAAVHESSAHLPVELVTSLRSGAEQIVKNYVPLAVGAGMIPLPGFDLAAIGGLQLKLLASLAEHYKVAFTQKQAELIVTSLLGSVGTTVLVGAVLFSIAKIVPFFGPLVGAASMPVAGGVITRAMGHLAMDHFEAGGTMETFDLDLAQKAFLEKIAEAKATPA